MDFLKIQNKAQNRQAGNDELSGAETVGKNCGNGLGAVHVWHLAPFIAPWTCHSWCEQGGKCGRSASEKGEA
jgi:hypothetical protein